MLVLRREQMTYQVTTAGYFRAHFYFFLMEDNYTTAGVRRLYRQHPAVIVCCLQENRTWKPTTRMVHK